MRIIEYLERRESDEIISDIGRFWTEMGASNQRILWVPEGWNTWWTMIMKDQRKQEKFRRAAKKKEYFHQRIQPDLALSGWQDWWKMMMEQVETEKRNVRLSRVKVKRMEYEERTKPNLILKGWTDWWEKAENEAFEKSKADRLVAVSKKHTQFKTSVEPNLMLKGWTTWWSKMEAEGRRDAKRECKLEMERECAAKRALQTSWMRSYFKPEEKDKHRMDKLEKINMDRKDEKTDVPSVNINCGLTTPKRKKNNLEPSLGSEKKRRKLSPCFEQNLKFWRKFELQEMPTDSALQHFSHTHTNKENSGGKTGVTRQRGNPIGDMADSRTNNGFGGNF